jgi:hypothetical protein
VQCGNAVIYEVYKTIPANIFARNGGTAWFPINDHPCCLIDEAKIKGVRDL